MTATLAAPPYAHCRHCQRPLIGKKGPRRGLCHRCRETGGLPRLYPPAPSKYSGTGEVPDYFGPSRAPQEATDALPGTEQKIQAMEARAALGLSLWHPDDATGLEGD